MSSRSHWENIYSTRAPNQVSWFRPHLETSLALVRRSAAESGAAIIDVGGGASSLADDLLADGYRNLTVLDISQAALDVAGTRLGDRARHVHWLQADITGGPIGVRKYDVWHDRAVFHFLTGRDQREAYVRNAALALKPGGHIIIGTFGPEGPEKCSGLEIVRYDAEALHGQFGSAFQLIESTRELHETPFGTTQQFLYCYCRLSAETA